MRHELEGANRVWGLLNCLGVFCLGMAGLGICVERCTKICPVGISALIPTSYLTATGLGMAAGVVAIVASITTAIHFCACSQSSCIRVVVIVFFFVTCALAAGSGVVYAISDEFDSISVAAMSIQLVLHAVAALTAFFCIFA